MTEYSNLLEVQKAEARKYYPDDYEERVYIFLGVMLYVSEK